MKLEKGNLALDVYEKGDGRVVPHGRFLVSHRNGAKALEGGFQHGKAHGVWFHWYASGQKRAQYEYVLGRPHGKFKQWYPSGHLAQRGGFTRGVLDGELTVFANEKGEEIRAKSRYEKGRKVGQVYQRSRRGKDLTMTLATRDQRLVLQGGTTETYAKRVCLMNVRGEVIVANVDDVTDFIGELLTPEQVEAYLAILNRIYSDFGLDTSNGLLLKCPTGFSALSLDAGSLDSPSAATSAELQAVGGACQSQATNRLGIDSSISPNAEWRNFVDQRVSQVDGIFETCVDRINPLVADTDISVDDVLEVIVEVVRAAVETVEGALEDAGDVVEGWVDTGAGWVEGKVGEALHVVSQAAAHPDRAVAAVALLAGFYALKAMSSGPQPFDQGYIEHEMAMDALSTAIKERALQWLEEGNVGDLSNLGDPQYVPDTAPGGGSEDMLPGSGGTCADFQAWWGRVKAYCETADWQTIECQQFLGASADCLERILPGPDGDPVCYGVNGTESDEDLIRAVRQRICEMTANGMLVADGFGNETCRQPDDVAPIVYDPCQDPHAQWLPDQCLDSVLGMATLTRAPLDAGIPLGELTAESFDREVMDSGEPVMVAFTATTCGPCARVVETLGDVTDEFRGRLNFRQVDVHQSPDLALRYNIRHTPTLVTFDRGQVVGERRVGAAPAERLLRYIDKTLGQCGEGSSK